MNLNLTGCRVIVTAGAAGIGLEVARAFVEEGAKVWICDLDAEAVLAQLACGAAVEAVAVGAALLLCKALACYNCSPNVPHRLLGFSVLERATHGLCVHLGGGDRVGQAEDLAEALRLSES